ncbi:MAG: hypothetical protein IPM54_06035 [Polyangiaceae bacterium]|nr:hypothetical protein [Polyangiaceae bacterium]
MKNRFLLRWALLSAASVSIVAMWSTETMLPTAAAAAPSASASASASAGSPERPLPIEPLEKQSVPTTKSPVPTLEEWKTAPRVEVVRRNFKTGDCAVFRVREWLKVKCEANVGAIYQHSGNVEGVAYWIRPIPQLYSFSSFEEKNGGEVIFPLRVGDRRLLQFFSLRHDPCIGIGFDPSVMVDETWIEGEPSPVVVLR